MPEPNLPPLRLNISEHFDEEIINVMELKHSLPEMPAEIRKNLKENYNLTNEMVFCIAVCILQD